MSGEHAPGSQPCNHWGAAHGPPKGRSRALPFQAAPLRCQLWACQAVLGHAGQEWRGPWGWALGQPCLGAASGVQWGISNGSQPSVRAESTQSIRIFVASCGSPKV